MTKPPPFFLCRTLERSGGFVQLRCRESDRRNQRIYLVSLWSLETEQAIQSGLEQWEYKGYEASHRCKHASNDADDGSYA